ncbi:hypothetical protein BC938DRAFT_481083 [Jimgerdemannia flammicorona]|uniref:SAM domain-containing protein n=1 Tax=Jimgerdemannia flammicorona TaxID=994334 RepID=A0A433QH06_9FUNG|nr:hypothetical protein BC938DRAFT_481083 [Jimgerdemannia flammicorona]
MTTLGAMVLEASDTVLASQNPSISEIESWETDHVITYLRSIFPEKDISNGDMGIIRNQQIAGRAFLNLTLDGLLACEMKVGPASNIMACVKKLNEAYHKGDGVDDLCYISDDRLDMIDGHLTDKVVDLLRSPPASGKTTLSHLLKDYLEKMYIKVRKVVRISMLKLAGEALQDATSFDSFWENDEDVNESWTNLLSSKVPTDIIIDEAQILYGANVPFFWEALKTIKAESGRRKKDKGIPKLRVLLLTATLLLIFKMLLDLTNCA